jgi:cytochrome c oxidase subunit 4
MSETVLPARTYVVVTVFLFILLGVAILVFYLPLGPLSLPAALAMAVGKAILVGLYFMHLRWQSGLMRLFAVVGLVTLMILLGLTLNDYLLRHV